MKSKLLYWLPTALLLLAMVGSAISYFINFETSAAAFTELGYPVYSMYFNASAKIIGAIALVFPVGKIAKEWAYAGYLFILLLAAQAIYMRMPEQFIGMPIFIAIWALSYWQFKKQSS